MKFTVQDLIEKRLVVEKKSPCGRYRLFKYSRDVFYNNLWHLDPRIVECRGIVVDEDDNIVLYPFTKVFNLGENKVGENIPRNRGVISVVKLNGFLAQAAVLDGELIVTSSGSFTGEFAEMAKKQIEECLVASKNDLLPGFTYMFEICDPSDPHIVHEDPGVYLIGVRQMSNPNAFRTLPIFTMLDESMCDFVALSHGFKRPAWDITHFGDVVDKSLTVKHEGFMVRDLNSDETLVKLKSKHYLNKKALMRLGKARVDSMFDAPNQFKKQRLEEEFYGVFDSIIAAGRENWRSLDEQGRRKFIEEYFNANQL